MASVGVFSSLKFLDFSGIHKVTANGLQSFLHMCPNIRPDMLFYCDDIVDGPYSTIANGCQNIDSSKVCCRNLTSLWSYVCNVYWNVLVVPDICKKENYNSQYIFTQTTILLKKEMGIYIYVCTTLE